MLTTTGRKRLGGLSALAIGAMIYWLAGYGQAQQPKARVEGAGSAVLKPLYFGVAACRQCHANGFDPAPVVCRCVEIPIWEGQDKHKNAYTNVFGPAGRGQKMVEMLKYSEEDKLRKCVSCHGAYDPTLDVKLGAEERAKLNQEGVTCVICHGTYSNWVDKHGSTVPQNRDEWRTFSREKKQNEYGMLDLWDAGKRAELCASCHIGNSAKGRVVTHDMYAVGHPPLPGIEVSLFSEVMPRHWQYLSQKKEAAQKLLGYDPKELELTKLVVVGGAVYLQEAMNLLSAQATQRSKVQDPEQRQVDLAQFDCYACHHDLKWPSWRQKRGYSGIPGRPQFRPWPLALVKLGMTHAGQEESQLRDALDVLHKAFDAQPFGHPEKVASAADSIARWAGTLKDKLNTKSAVYDKAVSLKLLHHLAALADTEILDYDTARQLAWAFRVIYFELDPKADQNPDFKKAWNDLDKELKLSLPATQQIQILGKELKLQLERVNEFEPARFKKAFAAVAKLLPKQ